MKKIIKNIKIIIKKLCPFILKYQIKNINKKRVLKEYDLFKKYNIESSNDSNSIGYKIIIEEHSLEKAMTSKTPRFFGKEKVHKIIEYLNIYEEKNFKKDYSYNIGISILFSRRSISYATSRKTF